MMLKVEDKSSVRRCKVSSKTLESNGHLSGEETKLESSFLELLSVFLKVNCRKDCFRPLPPMLGNGHSVDLLKLYCVVKQKGGFEAVSKNGLWGEVGLLYGVGPTLGSAIKLIYLKYLESLENQLMKLPISNSSHWEWLSSELKVGFSTFVSDIVDEIKKNSEHYVLKVEKSDTSFVDLTKEDDDNKKLNRKMTKMGFADFVDLTEEDFDNGKLKRKNIETGFAGNEDLIERNHEVKKLKRKVTKMRVESGGDLTEVNNDQKKLEKIRSEMSFADFASPDVSDARRLSVGPEVADNVIMGSESSDASKESYAQFEGESMTVDTSTLKEEVCSHDRVLYCLSNLDNGKMKRAKSEMSFANAPSLDEPKTGSSSVGPELADDVAASSENSDTSKKDSTGVEEKVIKLDRRGIKEDVSSQKRKQEGLSRMLHWMTRISKDPTDPTIGTIPESTEWAFFGADNCWKQVLLAREALFLKRNKISGIEQLGWQRKLKMHPSMFEDEIKGVERSSPRILSAKTINSNQERFTFRQRLVARFDLQPTASIYTSRPQQRIPVGRAFQVKVPEWTGVTTESDSKWLGTRVWPPEKRQYNLTERDPIGKGRVECCGCHFPGSTECVKFHICQRRMKIKLELGSLFFTWKFDKMGEECSVSWTAEEENKFKSVMKESPLSLYKCFWQQMCKILPKKSWPDHVNYYFNVFMLRRRGLQNRLSFCHIDSDDDETDYRSSGNRLASSRT